MFGNDASGSLSFDAVAQVYDDTRGYPPGADLTIAEAFMRYGPIAPGARTLEIGVGTGRIALPLLERGAHVSGIDISERMIERLRAKYAAERAARPTAPWGELEVTRGDITALPYPATSFDAVIAVHVLHLVPRWRLAFDEALRVLRPGAPLLLGQDVAHSSHVTHPMQDEWAEIVRGLGFEPHRVGAASFKEILAEARGRDLRVEEWLVADWVTTHTPAEAFSYIADRVWSLTWLVPDDIFTESVRLLETWAKRRFGDQWEAPIATNFSFKLARVTARRRD